MKCSLCGKEMSFVMRTLSSPYMEYYCECGNVVWIDIETGEES